MARGKKFLKDKDYARAILEFRNATKPKPNDAEPWYQLALASLAAKQTDQAVVALRQATKLNPNHKAAQLRLSQMMVQSRQPEVLEDAVKRLNQVLAADPDEPDALDALALADLKLEKPKDAVNLLRQALAKFPAHVQTSAALAALQYANRDFPAAEQTLKKAVEQAPKSADAALALAHLYFLEQKKFDAEAQLQRALALAPDNVLALLTLGRLQLSQGSTRAADQTYRKLAALPGTNLAHIHAAFLFQQGKREEAVQELVQLSNVHPADRLARLRLVAACTATGRMQDALGYLARILKSNPKDSDALLLRSRVYLDSGDVTEAERDLQAVLHFRPDSADAHYGMSRVYAIQGLERRRWEELHQVIRINPNLLLTRVELAKAQILGGQPMAALETLDAAPQEQKASLTLLVAHNWALLALNRTDEAQTGVEQGLRVQKHPDLLLQRSILKEAKKDFAGARLDAEEVVRMNPANTGALNLAIQTCLEQRKQPAALRILQEAAAKNATSQRMQIFVGQWLLRLGKPAEARQAFETAKTLNPRYTGPDLSLASLDIQEGNVDSARSVLSKVIAAEPRNENAHLLLANLEYLAKNMPAALSHFRAVAERNPDNVLALNAAAYLLASDDPVNALKYAEHALELAPGSAMVQDTLGFVYYRNGLYTEAVELLKLAVKKQPTAVHQYHLGMSFMKNGDSIQGQESIAKALAKDPNIFKTEVGW